MSFSPNCIPAETLFFHNTTQFFTSISLHICLYYKIPAGVVNKLEDIFHY